MLIFRGAGLIWIIIGFLLVPYGVEVGFFWGKYFRGSLDCDAKMEEVPKRKRKVGVFQMQFTVRKLSFITGETVLTFV